MLTLKSLVKVRAAIRSCLGRSWALPLLLACVSGTGCTSYGGKAYSTTLKAVDATNAPNKDAKLYYLSRQEWDRRSPGTKQIPAAAKPLPSINGEATVRLPGYEYMAIAEYKGADQQTHWVAQGPFTPAPNVTEIKVVVP